MLKGRKYGLGIWGLALGYFSFYIPYSAFTKTLSEGVWLGMDGSVSGFELLPATAIATGITMPLITTMLGWWKYAGRRDILGLSIPCPSFWTFISGISFAVIIATTTLAYTFNGISIVFALLLMRGGVLILAPLLDVTLNRKVRWFSWAALLLSLTALGIALGEVGGYTLSLAAVLNLAAYLGGYMVRLQSMTRFAKSEHQNANKRYFVEEQMVAMIALVSIPLIFAVVGIGDIMMDLRRGFTTFLASNLVGPALLIGFFYACLGIFGTLIYLDRRENTFCIPLNRCSSLLSGIAASFALTFVLGHRPPSSIELIATGLILISILVLSPLHHFGAYLGKVKIAFTESPSTSLGSLMTFTRRARELAAFRIPQTLTAENGFTLGKGTHEHDHIISEAGRADHPASRYEGPSAPRRHSHRSSSGDEDSPAEVQQLS